MTTCPPCGATWGGKRAEHCDSCHQTFSGTSAGDRHRVGDFNDGSRRCRTVREMLDLGMVRNSRGHWSLGGESPWAGGDA